MKNSINYYYNIRIDNLIKINEDYYFYLNNNKYKLIKYDRPNEDIISLYKLNIEMIKRNCMIHRIIINKDNQVITIINNIPYILLKLYENNCNDVFLKDINYMQYKTYNISYDKNLNRNDWVKLWSDKIDYYEYQINQLGKEYPILCDSLSYYIGLGENAISYLVNNIKNRNFVMVSSHKRIKKENGSEDFYDPTKLVIDSRVRDLSEYIKTSFFDNQFNMNEIIKYLNINNLTNEEYILLFSRLLFPTYYFDRYDEIINNNKEEKIILQIIDKNYEYERFLNEIYKYIIYEKKAQIEPIEWLIKNHS